MEQTHATPPTSASHEQQKRWLPVLLAGDVITFIVFAIIGRSSHGEAAGLNAAFEVLKTAAPFIAGWLLVAPWLGVYRPRPERGTGFFLWRTWLAWFATLPVALALRALLLQREVPMSFAIVTFIANTVLLLGWRGAFALFAFRKS